MSISEADLKSMIIDIGRKMYAKNFVAAHDGNISCRTESDILWVTPSGVSKGYMSEEMLVKTDLKGRVLEGELQPSSEIKMHLKVYELNPDAKAVVHAHPPVATAFAAAGIALDQPLFPTEVMPVGTVPLAPFAVPGTEEVPDSIAPFCRDFQGVLLANHGVLTWGQSLTEAYFNLEKIEQYAVILMYTRYIIGQVNDMHLHTKA